MRRLLVLVLLAAAACSGGKRSPSLPPVPTPQTTPAPSSGAPLACWSYAYQASAADLRDLAAIGVTAVLDYIPERLCERSAGSGLGIILPIYYGEGATFETIEPVTQAAVRAIAPCRDRVVAVYPFDEPGLRGVHPSIVNAAVASAAHAFPGLPTLIYEPKDSDLTRYPGLTLRGLSFYGRDARSAAAVRRRLARQPTGHGERYVLVARGFVERNELCCGGGYGRWTDAEVAGAIRTLAAEARATGHVVGLLPYIFQEPAGANPVPNHGWRDLPETRAAMRAICR